MFEMKLFALLAICCSAAFAVTNAANSIDSSLDEEWHSFKHLHGKTYDDGNEELVRRSIWESNLKYIRKHNVQADKGIHTYHLEMNRLGDRTQEEITFDKLESKHQLSATYDGSDEDLMYQIPDDLEGEIPERLDWRSKGYVSEVKDSSRCTSAWAFSAVGTLEGQMFRRNHVLVDLSAQQLVSCSFAYGNDGCRKGSSINALAYTADHGIQTAASYPYTASDATCSYSKSMVMTRNLGYKRIASGNETALKIATALEGPISVHINMNDVSFYFYSRGIYNNVHCNSERINYHALVVGYGDGFWIVKMSMGKLWGMNGYVLMSRDRDNQCGIATDAVVAVL